MLDYRTILDYRYVRRMSGNEIAGTLNCSPSGVNGFLQAFEACESFEALMPPFDPGLTNARIYEMVYGHRPGRGIDPDFAQPDYAEIHEQMQQKNMTIKHQWNVYRRKYERSELRTYSYRQFCRHYSDWGAAHGVAVHLEHAPGRRMEVDFAGRTFRLLREDGQPGDKVTVFVSVLPYSQAIYAEGMTDTSEPNWIAVHNNALRYFGGVPAIVVCDNCKQGVITNEDWIAPQVNATYQEWADWNGTAILPAKVRKPRYKSSVESAVGILEQDIFHELAPIPFFTLESFNRALFEKVDSLNETPFTKRPHSRKWFLTEERRELMPLPEQEYEYAQTACAKVAKDGHVVFDNAHYSVGTTYVGQRVTLRATVGRVRIYSQNGDLLADWDRATEKGVWKTDPSHMPAWYAEYVTTDEQTWIKKALEIGPATTGVIQQMLDRGTQPVQAYRRCAGVVHFAKTYSPEALEECCRRALESGHPGYTWIRDTIAAVNDELHEQQTDSKEKSEGDLASATSIDFLMNRTAALIKERNHQER